MDPVRLLLMLQIIREGVALLLRAVQAEQGNVAAMLEEAQARADEADTRWADINKPEEAAHD